jgi:hypothetical protein
MNSGNGQRPAFLTADECRAWLDQTPLTNPVQAQAQLLRQLNLLNREPLDAAERLAILERLRKPLLLVQEEGARRFVGKPLPLVPPEQAAFDAAQAVWLALLAGYRHCLQAVGAAAASRTGLIAERALATLVATQFDIYRAGFQPTPEHWRALHQLYAAAEQVGAADAPVDDTPRQGRTPASALALYAEALLLHAVSPHELPARHLVWVARWARRWSAKVTVSAAPTLFDKAIALCVDLASGEPAGHRPASGPAARWIDTNGVRQSLKKRLALLDQGRSPTELQLGDDCVQPACGRVLKQVYRRWCKGGVERGDERRTANGCCELIAGVEAIHYFLSGRKPFRQPSHADDEALRREREELATFGRVPHAPQEGFSEQHGYRVEAWQIVDESTAGIHAVRTPAQNGSRVARSQLVAIRLGEAQSFLLGSLRWAMITADACLHAGILLMPGRAEPVAARPLDGTAGREPFHPAFLLPAIETLGTAASIVIAPGQFKTGRVLEVAGSRLLHVRLLQLVDRGADFDCVNYEPVT